MEGKRKLFKKGKGENRREMKRKNIGKGRVS